MRLYNNYWLAKKASEKLGLKEAEYGNYNDKIAYCYWNRSGDREDEAVIECYYLFENGKPEKNPAGWLRDWTEKEFGLRVGVNYE